MGSQSARGRNDQLVRLVQIMCDLDRLGGHDVYELADRYGVSVRTIHRDLDALEAAGIPLDADLDGKRKRWRIDFRGRLGKLSSLLDASHYLALRVAMEPGAPMSSRSKVFATLEDLGQKIEQAIGRAGKHQLAAIEACFHPYEKRIYKDAPPDLLWPLVRAISEERLCHVTYRAPRVKAQDKSFVVLPLKLFAYDGTLYLACHVPKHDSLVTLNLQRLRELRLTRRRGRTPRRFDATAFEHASFGVFVGGKPTRYRLRFVPRLAPFIRERTWHPSQTLSELGDGGVELGFRCDASYEVTAWVQSWGDGVEVLEPTSLRAELREVGEWLVRAYAATRHAAAPAKVRPQRQRKRARH